MLVLPYFEPCKQVASLHCRLVRYFLEILRLIIDPRALFRRKRPSNTTVGAVFDYAQLALKFYPAILGQIDIKWIVYVFIKAKSSWTVEVFWNSCHSSKRWFVFANVRS